MLVLRRGCAAVVLMTSLAACTSDEGSPEAEPTPTITSLADLTAADLSIVRGDFCDRVAADAIEDSLGAEPDDSTVWRNGDRARIARGVRDVVHEYGCAWTAAGATARAWVFAPPVTDRRARELRRLAEQAKRCRPVTDATAFGDRSAAVTCQTSEGPVTSYHGRFGDAWLSCSLSGDDAERTGTWCVRVAEAAAAR